MTHLQISLLGPIQIVAAGKPLTAVTSPKILALLAYLSAEPARAHSRDALAELLWSGQTTGRQNLRQSLSRLIGALPQLVGDAPFFLAGRQEIGFNAASNHSLDLTQFTEKLGNVRRHRHPPPHQCQTCIEDLDAAAALYRGDFVDGLLVESPPFEEWALLKREWLRQEVLWALDLLARRYLEEEAYAQAHRYARRQIEIDPLREDGYRQGMLALAQDGQRNAALAQYEILADHLREDLGLAPSVETTALYEQIRAVPPTAAPSPPRTSSPRYRHNLPPQFTPFIGREEDRRQIHGRMEQPECRLLTLVGPGGMGKTRLAMQVAQERLTRYEDGVRFVSLAESTSAVQVIEAIADVVDARFSARAVTADKLRAELLRALRAPAAGRLLLVLDNCEHLLSTPDQEAILDLVLEIIGQTVHTDLLITSRQPLNLRAEWIVDVQGLPAPPLSPALTDPATLAEYEAVQFLVHAFERFRPEFRLDASSAGAVQQICALVGGAPLALELAAATIRTRTSTQIAEAIRQGLDSLDTSMRDMPLRHRSLRAVFEDAQRMLPPDAQIYFRRLSVFPASFSAQAAAEIADIPADGLTLLRQHSLLRQERADGRFSFHEMLRQFAAEQLAADLADAQRIHARHCHFYTALLAGQQTLVENGDSAEAAALIHAEMDNIRAAWAWAVAHGDVDALARGTHTLLRHYVRTHLAEEGARAFGEAAAAIQAKLDADPDPHPVQAAILADLTAAHARMLFKLACYKEAEAVVKRAIALAESASAGRPAALAHVYCGLIHLYQAQNADAQFHFETALTLARAAAWPKIECDALRGLGILYDGQKDWTRAEHYYTASLAISRQINDLRGAGASLGNMGVIRQHHGDYVGARACLEQALAVHEQIGDGSSVGRCLTYLGNLARDQGDGAAAEEFLHRACRTLRDIRDRHHEADALLELGRLYQQQGQSEQAIPCLERALALYREVEDRAGEAEAAEQLSVISDQ